MNILKICCLAGGLRVGQVIVVNLAYVCKRKGVYLQRNLVDNDMYENSQNGFGKCPYFQALIYGDGSVEIHRMSKELTKMEGSELDQMHEFFEDIT